ncbi:putative lysophospholipase, catalytic domain, Acyl transferase/acyl hydrolase/lysophospholipase [Septoria linicola]|nr:putative lysophospholipase, catalytic domain, Acyl transferase/acyl hydrolase/lysophospholipase [Septoria linicola]
MSMDEPKQGLFKRFYHGIIKPAFPEAITDLKILGGITALETRVKRDMSNVEIFPEVARVAEGRRGLDLCTDEQTFLARRKARARDSFASYLGLDSEDVMPEDVPLVAFGGRCLGYAEQMKATGLWDCLTYVAGVSGSCWALAAYYSFANANIGTIIDHCQKRLSPHHPFSGDAIRTILSTPGGARNTLGPLIQKSKSGLQTVAMDLYSVFITGWIFFHDGHSNRHVGYTDKDVAKDHGSWHRYSDARKYTDNGSEPLPILTAIRHERPWKDWHDKEHPFEEADHSASDHAEASEAWFQWFEMTPYEIGCDEIEAWVPTWGFGRPFENGKSTSQLPEQSLALLLGLATSAPAGPLASYLATISLNIPSDFLGNSVHKISHNISKFGGKAGTEEFNKYAIIHFTLATSTTSCSTTQQSIQVKEDCLASRTRRVHLIDSGMDNNCLTYVLLHPKRKVGVIINMDASSDVQKDSFQDRVDQIGSRRGLKFTKRHNIAAGDGPQCPERFCGMYAQIYDGKLCDRPAIVVDSYGRTVKNPPAPVSETECTMLYLPLLPNQKAVPDFDPSTCPWSGSYNLVWTAAQVETLVTLCKANFTEGQATIKEVLHEAWQRKKTAREASLGESGNSSRQ